MDRLNRRRRRASREFSFRPQKVKFDRKKIKKNLINWAILVFTAAVLGYSFVVFCFQTVTVFGPSMNNTLYDGQIVVVNKLSYKFDSVERFDIIAYSSVNNDDYFDIKRVYGLPGETIRIENGYIYINDEVLEQDIFEESIFNSGIASKNITLGKDEYFVLGDNINNSEDSRYTNIGKISKSEILGKVVYVYKPKNSRGKIK